MRTKFFLALAVALITIMLFSGCSGGNDGGGAAGDSGTGAEATDTGNSNAASDALTGSTADILQQMLNDAGAALGEENQLPEVLTDPVTAENSPGMLGVIADDFVGYVTEATSATAAINTSAFEIALIKCGGAETATTVEDLINSGFDSGKWICVMPEQSLTAVSGSYVLLAVGGKTQTDAIAGAFSAAAGGEASDPRIFYAGETGGDRSSDTDSGDDTELILG
jgi:hypothetical protein